MKVTIDIGDNWIDDGCLEESFKRIVVREAVSELKNSLLEETKIQISREVKEQINKNLSLKIKKSVSRVLKEEKIKANGIEYTVEEYIHYMFENGSSYDRKELYKPKAIIEDMASKFSKMLKDRYDLLFASQIVNKMSENNLVRKEVAELLLEK